jgi:hypothetical protein
MSEVSGEQNLLPTSTLTVPIRVSALFIERSLDHVLESLRDESGLIYQHDALDIGAGLTGVAQVWRRGGTHVVMAGDAIIATLPVRVVLKPAWKPGIGLLSLPMGISLPLEISAEYTVRLTARPTLATTYDLRLNATFEYSVDRPVGVEAVGLEIGITFGGATRRAAEEALHSLCDWLNSDKFVYLNFREQVARGWHALQQPVNLSPGHQLRLLIEPEGVYALPFHSDGNTGVIGLAVVARVRAQAASAKTVVAMPLPPISAEAPPQGVTLTLPLDVGFATLETALRENITDHPWHIEGRKVVLRTVEITGSDEGELKARVGISVTTEGGGFDVEATLSASGNPHLDIEKQHLSLEGFRYDAHTDSRLLNVLATLLRPFAGRLLEPWLEMPLAPHAQRLLDEANARLAAGIELGEGVTLLGNAAGVRLTKLNVTSHGLVLQVETHGELSIRADRSD